MIHPGVVARLGAARIGDVLELRPGERIERPALLAVFPRGGRPVEDLALAPVELREMSARQRRPEHAVAIDVPPARPVARERRLVDFRQSRLGRIRSWIDADDVAGESQRRPPHRAIDRIHGDRVEVHHDPLVLGGIERLIGLDVLIPLAVAVGIDDERRPALRFLLVAGLLEHLSIQPADDARAGDPGAGPQRVVGVLGEDEMVRGETRADQREFAVRRIVHREVTVGRFERDQLRRRMGRALLAEVRIRRRTDAGGEPGPSFLIHHRVVIARLAVPDGIRSPVRRGRHPVGLRGRRLRIADRMQHLGRGMAHRVQDRHIIRALLRRSIEFAVGIDPGVAPIGPDQIVEIGRGAAPVPQSQHDVAFHTLRPRRLVEGQLVGSDPVTVQFEGALGIKPADDGDHLDHGLPGHDSPLPRVLRILEVAELLGNRTRPLRAQRVTRHAAGGLYGIEPLGLTRQRDGHAVAAIAGARCRRLRGPRRPDDRGQFRRALLLDPADLLRHRHHLLLP